MIWILGNVLLVGLGLGALLRLASQAPEGYEDQRGFHFDRPVGSVPDAIAHASSLADKPQHLHFKWN